MVAQSSKGNEWVEDGDALARISSVDAALAADKAGKEDLVKGQKLADQQRKEGKVRSGITNEFGILLVTGLESIGFGAAAQAMRSKWWDVEAKSTSKGQDSTTRDIDPGFVPKGSEKAREIDSGFMPKGSEKAREIDPGFTPKGSEKAREIDSGFIPKGSEKARDIDLDFTPIGSAKARDIDPGFTPKGSEKARDIDPGFTPKGSENTSEIDPGFTPKGSENTREIDPGFMPPVLVKPADAPLQPSDAPAKPAAGQRDTASLTLEQQKAAKETGLELAARFFLPGTDLEAVRKSLYGKTEAELRAIDAAFKEVSGKGLEETFRVDFQGAELDQALAMLNHKDNDLVPIPQGVDRAALIKTAEAIHDKVGGWLGGPRILKELVGAKPEEIKAMVALYKDMYGVELAAHLKDEMSAGEFEQISKLLPQTTETKDHSRVEVLQGKVLSTLAADGHGREFKYDGGQLTEVKSTFTGHTWKRTEVNGKEEWVNEKGTVWKGKFSVGPDGNLTFAPHDGKAVFVFTPEGKTLRVPAETEAKSAAPTDSKSAAKSAAVSTDAKAVDKSAVQTDATAGPKPADKAPKQAEAPVAKADAPARATDGTAATPPTDAPKELAPLNPEQQRAAERAGLELADKFSLMFVRVGSEDVRECLYGKTEAEIRAIDATFKEKTGKGLEETFREEFQGAELSQVLEMLKHKDTDLLPLPEGVDRAALVKANTLIVGLPDINVGNTTEELPRTYDRKIDPKALHEIFAGKTATELQAMNVLFKDCYGVTLEEYLQKKSFVPLRSLDKYAMEANEAKAAKENFESEVQKVDQRKIAEAAKIIHDSTGKVENFALRATQEWNRPNLGEHPAQKAIQNLSPAEMEALKRHYKGEFGEDIKERVKEVPYYGESLERTLDRSINSGMNRIPVEKQAELREAAKKIWVAFEVTDRSGTDEQAFYKIMEGRSAAERAAIGDYYFELTGRNLEEHTISEFKEDAAELEKALNYLRIGSEVESANLHLAITENNAAHAIERVTTMTPAQLLEAEKDIKERYGKSLRELIDANEGMTAEAKEALRIYLDSTNRQPGANGRKMTDEEYAKVIELSLHARKVEINNWGIPSNRPGDLKMFQNILADAPPQVREKFWKEGGEEKIEAAFPDDGSQGDAQDYAKFGRLSVERKIHKGDRIDDDEPGIVKAADDMDQKTERDPYLRGARIFKEKFLDRLTEEERKLVKAKMCGEWVPEQVRVPEFDPSTLTPPLTAEELKDYEKFKSIGAAIDGPADDEEHRDWRDHAVYSGGVEKAKEFIEQVPFEKLQAIKGSAEAREKFIKENNFDLLSDHARKQVEELLDKKLLAEKPEDLKYAEGKALKDVLKLDGPFYTLHRPGVNEAKEGQKIVEGIMQMPLADQQKYRQDSEYRKQVDERVKTLLDGAQEEAALHMLESVAKGGYPVGDWIDNINIEAGKNETSEPEVIRYVEEEFRKDHERVEQLKKAGKPVEPAELRERISNPKTSEDQALKERLDRALHKALDKDEYERWGKPVLENGRLTIEQKIDLDRAKGGKEDVYKDVAALAMARDAASIEERHRLAGDANYRQQVLGHLPAEERELAEKIIKQSALVPAELGNTLANVKPEERKQILERLMMDERYRQEVLPGLSERDQRQAVRVLELGPVLPEDAVRAYKIGAQPSKEEMMVTLREMDKNSAQERDFKAVYADAFHQDVADDLASKLEGKDKTEMQRLLRDNPKTGRELYFRTAEQAESENSGFAADLTRWWGSQAGDLAEDSARQMYVKLAQAAERGEEIAADDKELQKLAKDALEYTDIFAEAKQASVDAVVGIALSVATIAVPGGLSLKLLYWTVGGGIGKVAMKAAILGDEYDGKVMKDFVSGAVDTAFSAVGGAQIAKVMRLGSKVGAQATKELFESAVAKPLIKEGEQVLQKTLQKAVAEEIAHGSGMISDQAVTKIVNKVAIEGATDAEKAVLTESIKASLGNAIKAEVREGAQRYAQEAGRFLVRKGLDAGAGYVGGFAGGFTGGLFEWDSSKSWDENLGKALDAGLQAGKGGLVGGAAFSTGFSVLGVVARGTREGAGQVWNIIRGKDVPGPAHLSNPEEIASAGYFAVVRSKDAPHPSPKDRGIEVTPEAMKSLLPVGKTGYFIGDGGVLLKKVEDLPNGNAKLVRDQDAALVARADVAAKLENRSAKVVVDMDAPGVTHGADSAKIEAQAQKQQRLKIVGSEGDVKSAHGEIDNTAPKTASDARNVDASKGASHIEARQRASVESPVPNDRVYKVGEKSYDLMKRPMDGQWFWGGRGGSTDSPVKVHVMVKAGTEDIGALQAVLIPALKNDPELLSKVSDWKTFDPNVGLGKAQPGDKIPTGVGQDAKGFTIYAANAADAAALQRKLDELLYESGLGIDQPLNTGTADTIRGKSNRVGIVRDTYPVAQAADGSRAYGIDAPLAKQIQADPDLGATNGGRLSDQQLRAVEKKAGLKEGTLALDSQGNLVLKAQIHGAEKPKGLYAGEDINQKPGELTDRRALHALAETYGMSQGDLAAGQMREHAASGRHETQPSRTSDRGVSESHSRAQTADSSRAPTHVAPDDPNLLAVGDTTKFNLRPAPDTTLTGRHAPDTNRTGLHPVRETHADTSIGDSTVADGRLRAGADVSNDIPPLVRYVLDTADIPPAERTALLARINEIRLAKPEVMDNFSRRAAEIMPGWRDASDLPAVAKASFDQMTESCHHFQDKVLAKIKSADGSIDRSLLPLLDDPREASRIFNDDPEIIRAAEEYITHRNLNAESQRVLHDTLKERVGEMQKLLDKLADEQGVARVKFDSGDTTVLGPTANGHYLDNKIVVKQELLLRTSDPATLLEVIYHEFVHHEQTNLMIRGVIDDIEKEIGGSITREHYNRFQQLKNEAQTRTLSPREVGELEILESKFTEIDQLYLEKTGKTIPREQLEEVLRVRSARGEQHLTPVERVRAEALYVDFKNMEGLGPNYVQAGTDLRVTASELEKLDGPIGAMDLIERLDKDKGPLSRHLFGTESPPADIQSLIRTYKRFIAEEIKGWPEEQAKFALKVLLEKQKETLEVYRSAVYKDYISKQHEVEAFVIGYTLKTRVQNLSAPEHIDFRAEDTGVFEPTDFVSEDTGVFKRAGNDAEDTGVFKRAGNDDEDTGLFKRADADGKPSRRSNTPAESVDPPDLPRRKPERPLTAEEAELEAEWKAEGGQKTAQYERPQTAKDG